MSESTVISTASSSSVASASAATIAPDVAKKGPPPLHIIFFFIINIWFCLCIAPFLAAGSNPERNLQHLKIIVADFDGGDVGLALKSTVTGIHDHLMPDFFSFEYHHFDSADDVVDAVRNAQAYAAIYANNGASASLSSVLSSNCASANTYKAADAYTIVWDEARSYATENKIFGTTAALIPLMNLEISSQLLINQSPSTIASCISSGLLGATFLTNPVGFTPINLSPMEKAPVGNGLLTIGNILVAVFSSLFFVNAIYKGASANTAHLTPTNQTLFRFILFLVYDFGLAACLSTIVVGLAKDGSGDYLYSGAKWAQIFALQWVHAAIWTFGTACVFIGASEILVPYNFCFILCSSILGGWNTDFADPSYFVFYKIFPFTWVNNVEKYILYGSLPHDVGKSVGILLAEAAFFVLLFFWINYKYYGMRVCVFDLPFLKKSDETPSAATPDAIELTAAKDSKDYTAVNADDKQQP